MQVDRTPVPGIPSPPYLLNIDPGSNNIAETEDAAMLGDSDKPKPWIEPHGVTRVGRLEKASGVS